MTVKAEDVGGGRYRVRIYFGAHPETGNPVQRSRYFKAKNQREANKLAARAEAELRESLIETRTRRGTLDELVDLWVRHRAAKDSPATIYRRQSIVAAIKRDLGRIRLADLTSLHIDQWYDKLRTEDISQSATPKYRSESTVHHYGRVLAAVLFQGWKWQKLDMLPGRRAEKPKRRQHARVKAPPAATVMLLIANAPPDLAVAARVLAATGLRRGELAALRWTDIDLDTGMINVTKSLVGLPGGKLSVKAPKNDESIRVVQVDATTIYDLDRHRHRWMRTLELAPDAYLFPDPLSTDRTGRTPRSPDWMTRGWRHLCEQHSATIRLHDLRHAHASILIDRGIPVTAVSARLGHAKTSTTHDIYGHPTNTADGLAALEIETALREG